MTNIIAIIFTIAISIFALLVSSILYNYIWIKGKFLEIPLDKEDNDDKRRGKNMQPINSFIELMKVYCPLWYEFDSKYWIYNIGIDGYSYIYLQKEIFKMLFIYGLLTVCIFMPIKTRITGYNTKQLEDLNIYNHIEIMAIFDTAIIYLLSIYCMLIIYKVKRHIKVQNIIKNTTSKNSDLENLKMRSLHVRGLYPQDRRGELLRMEIETFLECSGGGRMLSMIILPDFTEIITLENERKMLDNAQKLYIAKEPAIRRLLYPKRFREEQYFEKELQIIDKKIEEVVMKPIMSSGHAFICLDSYSAKQRCLEHFKLDTRGICNIMSNQIKDKVDEINARKLLKNERKSVSTFGKFNDEEALNNLRHKEFQIIAENLYDSIDIFWSNMGGTRGLFFFRRLFINITAIFILLFLTTPTAAFRALEQIDFLNLFESIQSLDDGYLIGHLLKDYFPPIIILLLNQLLIMLLDYAAYLEKHATYSLYQLSIFRKSVFYLMLNMLIIPGLTMATADSVFKLIFGNGDSLTEALKHIYFSDSGSFYIIILIQSSSISASSRLLRIGEIIGAFGSTWLAHYKRTYLNDYERWRRGETDIFAYGFNFADVVCVFTIIIIFSLTTPAIIGAGIIYFLIKSFIDGYSLLIIHKKEIESSGSMINEILKYTLGACCIFQFTLACSFIFNGFIIAFIMTFLIFLVSLILMLSFSDKKEHLIEDDFTDPNISIIEGFSKQQIKKWERYYSHPLLVTNTELIIPREDVSRSYAIAY